MGESVGYVLKYIFTLFRQTVYITVYQFVTLGKLRFRTRFLLPLGMFIEVSKGILRLRYVSDFF